MNEGSLSLPALDNGQTGHTSHAVVSTAAGQPDNLLWDVVLALVVAVAAPFILKRALESEKVRSMFRLTLPPSGPLQKPDWKNLDTDDDLF